MLRARLFSLILMTCLLGSLFTPGIQAEAPYDPFDYWGMVEHFRQTYDVDGSGVTIAVIDTGIDPAVTALSGGDRSRLIEWIDFTSEGLVRAPYQAQVSGEHILLNDGTRVALGARRSRSGVYRYGWLEESSLPSDSGIARDLNGNGRSNDRFLVVLVDSLQPGVYDTVYVNTRGNFSLVNERPLFVYGSFREHLTFPGGTVRQGVSLVVAELSPQGNQVKLGFDGHGHGTQVASIAAADHDNHLGGVAPGVRLMSLKALSSDGYGSWNHLRDAMRYAAENGADIALVSATGLSGSSIGDEGRYMDQLSREFGTLFVLVAGNDGPGLGTISANLASEYALIVGAYATPNLMQEFFELTLSRTIVMPYSGVGPAGNLLPGPSVVAPAAAYALLPDWHTLSHRMLDGTSAAAPHVAGGVALLIEALHRYGISPTVQDLRRALMYGATPIRNYDAFEQGFGVPDLTGAYDRLTEENRISPHYVSIRGDLSWGGHLNVRRQRPAQIVLELVSRSTDPFYLMVDSPRAVQPNGLQLTPAVARSLRVETSERLFPGRLQSERLDLYDLSGALINSAFISHVNPHRGSGMSWETTLDAGLRDRKFICVEEGTTLMAVQVKLLLDRDGKQGVGEAFIYDPAGNLAAYTGLLGSGQIKSEEYIMLTMPAPGVYELVTVMDVTTSLEIPQGRISLKVELEGYGIAPVSSLEESQHLVRLSRIGAAATAFLEVIDQLGQPPEMLTVRANSTVFRSLSTVPEGLKELIVRIGNPTVLGADLNLYLYYFDPMQHRWTEVGASVTNGTAEEWIIINQPLPGNYLVYIEAANLQGAPETLFRFEEHLHAKTLIEIDPEEVRLVNSQTVGLRISYDQTQLPHNPHLRIKEDDHAIFATLVSLPTEASGNLLVNLQPGVRVEGQSSQAWLTVLCGEELRPLAVVAVVNGRLYPVHQGRALIDILADERQLIVRLLGDRHEPLVELEYPVPPAVSITHDYFDEGDVYRRFITQMSN